MIIKNKVIHRRYVAAIKYILIAISLITTLIIIIQKGKNKMQKKHNKPKLLKLEKFDENKIRKLLNKKSKEILIDILVDFEHDRISIINTNRQSINKNILRKNHMEDFEI